MTRQFTALLLAAMTIFPVAAEEPSEAPDESTDEAPQELTNGQLELADKDMASERRGFVIDPGPIAPDSNRLELSGKWIEKDGVLLCDGYLTRIESEDYCEAQVPADWEPYEFEGRTYYMIPLADSRG